MGNSIHVDHLREPKDANVRCEIENVRLTVARRTQRDRDSAKENF